MNGYQHLFIPGPTNVPEPVRQAMNLPMEDMRAPDFPGFVTGLLTDLKKAYRMESGRVFVFPSSGTGAWESAIQNTLQPGDKVLMSRFGQFSLLWVDMAERLGLAGCVEFAGYRSQADVREYLRRSDVFVLPSFAEGVPVVLMEAMAAGVPVVTTRIAGVSELVEDGVSGYLVPPSDSAPLARAIAALLDDPALRARFGAAGRATVEREFDVHREAAWLLAVMSGAIEGRTEGARPAE